jgi:uridine phosphorylase
LLGGPVREGLIVTRDNFYRGVELIHLASYQTLSQANVLAVEMECSALFIIGSLRQVQTAAILAVDGNLLAAGKEEMDSYQPHRQQVQAAITIAIRAALHAFDLLDHESG